MLITRHAGISRKSRSLFLELDATAAKTARPVTPVHPKTPTEISRRARDVSLSIILYILYLIEPSSRFEIVENMNLSAKIVRIELLSFICSSLCTLMTLKINFKISKRCRSHQVLLKNSNTNLFNVISTARLWKNIF